MYDKIHNKQIFAFHVQLHHLFFETNYYYPDKNANGMAMHVTLEHERNVTCYYVEKHVSFS